jgi:hypothetical protein
MYILNKASVIGGAVGGSIAGIAILLLCLLWYRKQRRIRTENMIDPVDLENSGVSHRRSYSMI